MRIGYLVPEFPGQTHAFFWREMAALEQLGVTIDLVSTRSPVRGVAPHGWAAGAIARTTYLYPMTVRQIAAAAWTLLKSGPAAWGRCAAAMARLPLPSLPRMAGLAACGARLAALGREREWTHLHVHSCADAANAAMYANLLCGLPYSLTLHGDLQGYGANQSNKWRHAAFAIVVCRSVRQQVSAMVGPAQPASITVAPMGVDMELFTRQTSYQPPQSRDELRLFSCGRLHPGKGHDDLIRAVAWLHREGVDVKLTIAGADVDGDGYRTRLERLIGQLGLSLRVHLAGALSEQAVVDQLERAHLFVLASHHEALGVATMEAMAMEVPVVVTRTGGVPELVEDGCEGVLVAPRHPIELARAVRGLAASPLDCRRMGRAGRRKIEAGFHSGISARAILDGIVSSQSRRPMDRRIRASEAATP